MQTQEWSFVDKSEWPRGEWDSEPDKMQWMTAAGLPGLIVRGPVGALCGYVGVPDDHPLSGISYGSCPEKCGGSRYPGEGEAKCEHEPPDSRFSVHGGLTFSDFCHEPTRESWEKWRASMLARKAEATTHPKGDMARAWKERANQIDDYDAYEEYARLHAVCHVAEGGRVWWFGFDCSHSGDLAPEMLRHAFLSRDGEHYRSVTYVQREVESLAEQLSKVAA